MHTDRALTVILLERGSPIFIKNGRPLSEKWETLLFDQTPPPPEQTPSPLVNRITDRCKDIIFPHTSYTVGNYCLCTYYCHLICDTIVVVVVSVASVSLSVAVVTITAIKVYSILYIKFYTGFLKCTRETN